MFFVLYEAIFYIKLQRKRTKAL